MTNQFKKDRYREPQEEFIDDGLAANKKSETRHKLPNYEEWSLEELQREARVKGVENYISMDKNELIIKLKAVQK